MNSKEEGELFQDMQPRRQIFKRNISLSFVACERRRIFSVTGSAEPVTEKIRLRSQAISFGNKFVIRLVSSLFLIFIDNLIVVIILSQCGNLVSPSYSPVISLYFYFYCTYISMTKHY